MTHIKMKIEKYKNPMNLYIHPKRRILTKGNLHGYKRLSKVQKDMGLQKQCRERERKRTRACFGYVSLLCDIIDKEPSNYEEATENKEWKDAMIKEY